MAAPRPNLTPAYVLATAVFFTTIGIAFALLGRYVDLAIPERNLLIIAMITVLAGFISLTMIGVAAVKAASRTPSASRELSELRDQLQTIHVLIQSNQPGDNDDQTNEITDNIARLQQHVAQSQEELAQLHEMTRQVMTKLDSLRSVATIPSPGAIALANENDDTGEFPAVREEAPSAEIEPEEIEPAPVAKAPRIAFRPTPPPDDSPAEQFDSLEVARARVEDLMALSNWESALSISRDFADQHHDDTDAQWLRQRVQREYDIYREGSVRRLYEQIKDELERKHYRRALSIARRLLDKFADHKRAQKVRQQLPTILENAEIEERQEDEARIQGFIKSKRYQDAVELGEALLAKYPMSPQAESLDEMLPKLRQLAIEQEAETLGQR